MSKKKQFYPSTKTEADILFNKLKKSKQFYNISIREDYICKLILLYQMRFHGIYKISDIQKEINGENWFTYYKLTSSQYELVKQYGLKLLKKYYYGEYDSSDMNRFNKLLSMFLFQYGLSISDYEKNNNSN